VTTPFYTSPEQIVRDRSEYARKGIARGRSNVVLTYEGGIAFVAENPSSALHKISEIYDRIALAAVGRYNEFESLRVAGVRLADMRGYAYDRRDVTGRALANAYAQTLGSIFIENQKPYEVEIVVAEVGASAEEDQIYRLTYDGSVSDEQGFVAMGGQADAVAASLREHHQPDASLQAAVGVAVRALEAGTASQAPQTPVGGHPVNGVERRLSEGTLEVAVLDRTRPRRCFRRITGARLGRLLEGSDSAGAADAPETPNGDGDAPDSSNGDAGAE
jgi:proteasome alpha subunit